MKPTASSLSIDFERDLGHHLEPPLRILLADPSRNMRTLLALVLRREGHDVIDVGDGATLLEELASTLVSGGSPPFDLVIVEQRLPGITGLAVLAGLREHDISTPFILFTESAAVQAQARQLGAVVLNEPFNVESIKNAVNQAAYPA